MWMFALVASYIYRGYLLPGRSTYFMKDELNECDCFVNNMQGLLFRREQWLLHKAISTTNITYREYKHHTIKLTTCYVLLWFVGIRQGWMGLGGLCVSMWGKIDKRPSWFSSTWQRYSVISCGWLTGSYGNAVGILLLLVSDMLSLRQSESIPKAHRENVPSAQLPQMKMSTRGKSILWRPQSTSVIWCAWNCLNKNICTQPSAAYKNLSVKCLFGYIYIIVLCRGLEIS